MTRRRDKWLRWTVAALWLALLVMLLWPVVSDPAFLMWPGWIDLSLVACVVGLALAASFVVRYHVTTGGAWRRTPEGRWTLYRRCTESAVFGLTLVNYFYPTWPGALFASFLLLAAFALQTYVPHHLLGRAQRDRVHAPEHPVTR